MRPTRCSAPKVKDNNEDLRALINAGHQQGTPTLRCVGPLQIADEVSDVRHGGHGGIGQMPDTITDRGISFAMAPADRGERGVAVPIAGASHRSWSELRGQLAAWAGEPHRGAGEADPEMPVEDRAADTWEPLIAVADAAGGHWPSAGLGRRARRLNDAAEQPTTGKRHSASSCCPTSVTSSPASGVSFLPSDEVD